MKLILGCLFVAAVCACESKNPTKKPIIYSSDTPEVTTTDPKKTSTTAKLLASGEGAKHVAQIQFEKGSSKLSLKNMKKVKDLFTKAKSDGKIEEVQLVTWADEEYPSEDHGGLTKKQKNLVDSRNKNLKAYLNKLDKGLEVNEVSMAERTSAIGRFISADESEVKESLEDQKTSDMASNSIIYFIQKK